VARQRPSTANKPGAGFLCYYESDRTCPFNLKDLLLGSKQHPPHVEQQARSTKVSAAERAAQLEKILDQIPEAVIVTDAEGEIARLNQAAALLLGGGPRRGKPQRWPARLSFYMGDGKTKYPRKRLPLQRALRGETVEDEELFVRNEDRALGSWVAMSARPLTDGSQEVTGAILVFRDVSHRKEVQTSRAQAERALNESEQRFRSIFESTTLGMKVLDLDGSIVQTNRAFQQMAGRASQELIGRRLAELLPPADAARLLRFFERLKKSALSEHHLTHRILRPDGSQVWVSATFAAVRKSPEDDHPAFVVAIAEDITAQKDLEMEMAELKNRLQANVEMERLQLAQHLHDGPMQELYSVIYQIGGLRKKIGREQGEVLENLGRDIQRVVQELRSTAQELRPPTIANFGLEKAIRSHVADFRLKNPEIRVRLALDSDGQSLPEDARLSLFRIYQQSLANVARHAAASEVSIRFSFDAEEARLTITDNGQGFDVPRNWVGLVRRGHFGLAGAAERAEALHGAFSVESQPGKGTTISAVIPCREPGD
jgi:two-component system sensor histidine kinase UhpB